MDQRRFETEALHDPIADERRRILEALVDRIKHTGLDAQAKHPNVVKARQPAASGMVQGVALITDLESSGSANRPGWFWMWPGDDRYARPALEWLCPADQLDEAARRIATVLAVLPESEPAD
jgi:hypothetical protein